MFSFFYAIISLLVESDVLSAVENMIICNEYRKESSYGKFSRQN